MRMPQGLLLLLGTLLVIGALYNHYLGHSAYLVEIIFIAVGVVIATADVLWMRRKAPETEDGIITALYSLAIPKKHVPLAMQTSGFLLILAWTSWKLFVVGAADLRMQDFMVTLFGLSLILYPSGPSKFTSEKDFLVLYFMFLTIVFVVIWNAYSIVTGESYGRITGYSEFYFVTTPTVLLLRLFGVDVETELDIDGYGLSNIIKFDYEGNTIWLGIGTGCSGLYSSGLFFSAFLAFVLVRYRKVDLKILLALGLGFLVTWFSNIFRMAITVLVGSHFGPPSLSFFHSYFGIIVFVIFTTVFWVLIVRWLDKVEVPLPPAELKGDDAVKQEQAAG
jgi:exosortase/archaeosortase family protein